MGFHLLASIASGRLHLQVVGNPALVFARDRLGIASERPARRVAPQPNRDTGTAGSQILNYINPIMAAGMLLRGEKCAKFPR
jgi:hypothetical protein